VGDRASTGGGRLAGQGDDRADLLGGEGRRRARARRVSQPLGDAVRVLASAPASSPQADRLGLDRHDPGRLAHALAVPGQQDDPSPRGKLLGRAVGAAQPLQRDLLLGAQGDGQGGA
jgi:hypothetical protein